MALATPQAVTPQRVDWDTFLDWYFPWRQGEHVVIVGPTGCGKSTLMRSLLTQRSWVCVLCSKKKDDTYQQYLRDGYHRYTKWPFPPPKRGETSQHGLLWPQIKTMADLDTLGPVFRKALDGAFVDENWTVALDDLFYLCQKAKVAKQVEGLNYQVRSVGVSLVSCLQRPAWIPKSTWDQASYAFLRRLNNLDDLRTISGLAMVSPKELEGWTRQLQRYEWLYLPVAHGDTLPPLIVKPPA